MPVSDLLPWNREKDKYAVQRRQEYDPLDFQREMNRMIEDFFQEPFAMTPFRRKGEMQAEFSPRMDISETDKDIRITVDLPGMDEKDINITLENGVISISGEKKVEKEEKERSYHRVERSYGSFRRSFELPGEVDFDKVEATFKKGVLEVVIPKPTQTVSSRKRIEVKAG